MTFIIGLQTKYIGLQIMSDFNNDGELDKFLDEKKEIIPRTLSENILTAFGGLDGLIGDYNAVKDNGIHGAHGVEISTDALTALYEGNKDEFNQVVSRMATDAGFKSVAGYVMAYAFDEDSDGIDGTEDWETAVMKSKNDVIIVSHFMVWVVAEQICMLWEKRT